MSRPNYNKNKKNKMCQSQARACCTPGAPLEQLASFAAINIQHNLTKLSPYLDSLGIDPLR